MRRGTAARWWVAAAVVVLVVAAAVLVRIALTAGPPATADPASTPRDSPSAGSSSPAPTIPTTSTATAPTPTADSDCSAQDPCEDPEPTVPALPPRGEEREPVDVVVTGSGWDDAEDGAWVSAYVPGVEEGGVCTLVLSRSGRQVEIEQDALADASTTICGSLLVPHSELEAGTWSGRLAYASPTRTGESSDVVIEVP